LVLAFAPISRAHDPEGAPVALEKADKIEAEGRSMIEHGHRGGGKRRRSRRRGEFAPRCGAPSSSGSAAASRGRRPAALKERIEHVKAASTEAEKAGHELCRRRGSPEEAAAKLEESGPPLEGGRGVSQKKIGVLDARRTLQGSRVARDVGRPELDRGAGGAAREEAEGRGRATSSRFEGGWEREPAAKTATERAHPDCASACASLEASLREASSDDKDTGPAPAAGLEAEVKALHKQMDEMRAMLEDLRQTPR